ncbi:MAG TPA: phosphoribosylglycinamide formyltransferase [Burkholderiales bacterium]|jgi:phosphoribosylglycinamide formyltransferase-1|nr:phosphoribosylglycinamide formyltransferase [Burkholderiales bacterium]
MKRIVILISGRGSNLQSILDAKLDARIAAVISNNPAARGIDVARTFGVETAVIDHRAFPDRASFDAALVDKASSYRPDLLVLAGFMRVLSEGFIKRFSGHIMNIHPSLLPAFPGMDTHRRALQEGVRIHGCTVHFVTPELDHGPIIVQAAVPVLPGDDVERLAARVLEQEHRVYPQAIRWFLDGKLKLEGNRVMVSPGRGIPEAMVCP